MVIIKGWKLNRISSGHRVFVCKNGMVEYRPAQKYRIEKKNAFDPTFIHQREPYREDTFVLEGILMPTEYDGLVSMLTAGGQLYLEFDNKQFPVTVKVLPECPDDLFEYPEKVKFTLEARYVGSPGYVDFAIIISTDVEETVV